MSLMLGNVLKIVNEMRTWQGHISPVTNTEVVPYEWIQEILKMVDASVAADTVQEKTRSDRLVDELAELSEKHQRLVDAHEKLRGHSNRQKVELRTLNKYRKAYVDGVTWALGARRPDRSSGIWWWFTKRREP